MGKYYEKYQREYLRERIQWLKEHHLCVVCKKQDERTLQGFSNCKECAEKANERAKRRYRELKAKKGKENE
jgi:ribosomal protein L37AE/L43A